MATYRLKRVNLMLHEGLYERLQLEARKSNVSTSALVRRMLGRSLGMTDSPGEAIERIRSLRQVIGPVADSTPLVRDLRDRC